MVMRWRVPERWTRATLWWSFGITAFTVLMGVIVGLIWGGDAAFNVIYVWIGVMALVLTSDLRPPLNTPRSVLPKSRP